MIVLDTGNPVALPSSETGAGSLAVKIRRFGTDQCRVDVIERVDVDDSIKVAVDKARHDGNDSATSAYLK
jgi:hypothetical protein